MVGFQYTAKAARAANLIFVDDCMEQTHRYTSRKGDTELRIPQSPSRTPWRALNSFIGSMV